LGKDDDTSLLNLREFIGGGSVGCEFYTEMFETIPLELIDGIFTVGSKYLLGDTSGNGTLSLDAQPADAKEHVYLPYIVR
jgi:hypothetical protein